MAVNRVALFHEDRWKKMETAVVVMSEKLLFQEWEHELYAVISFYAT